jgi:hypothetical protein
VVATLDGTNVGACLSGGARCIVASRQARFVAHRTLSMAIRLQSACVGVVCPGGTTCEQGACVSAAVDCTTGACNPSSDGGADGAVPPIVPLDAGAFGDGGVGAPCIDNGGCVPTTFCSKPTGACLAAGACTERPKDFGLCADLIVCGCDGVTYGNACAAAAAGVSVDAVGACSK